MVSVLFIKYRAKPFVKDTRKLNNIKAQDTDKSNRELGQTDQAYRPDYRRASNHQLQTDTGRGRKSKFGLTLGLSTSRRSCFEKLLNVTLTHFGAPSGVSLTH